MMLPDEQYPTLPFRSPYIHTADSGPSAIVYYPQPHPIYEAIGGHKDIYSQVSKKGNEKEATEQRGCDSDNAALERLSQLLTTSKESTEVSSIVKLAEAPMASQEESSLGGCSVQTSGDEAANKSIVYQELDDAFSTLDQELLKPYGTKDEQSEAAASADGQLIVSAPTAI